MGVMNIAHRTNRRVYDILRQRIITGVLRPGEVVNEAAIMEELKIGRTPLREAVLLLIAEGLVRTFPRRGTFVSELTVESLQQALEMRPRLEVIAIELCCDRATDDELEHLVQLGQEPLSDSPAAVLEFDFNVHSQIVKSSHNEYLFEAWTRVYTACSRLKYSSFSPIQSAQAVQRELREVVDNLQRRDVRGTKKAMDVHLRSFIQSLGPLVHSDHGWLVGDSSRRSKDMLGN